MKQSIQINKKDVINSVQYIYNIYIFLRNKYMQHKQFNISHQFKATTECPALPAHEQQHRVEGPHGQETLRQNLQGTFPYFVSQFDLKAIKKCPKHRFPSRRCKLRIYPIFFYPLPQITKYIKYDNCSIFYHNLSPFLSNSRVISCNKETYFPGDDDPG